MKRFSEQLQKKAGTLRLSATEKRELKSRIVSYMEYHPLPEGARSPLPSQTKTTLASLRVFANNFYLGRAVSALVVVFLIGVPVIAERAVPGDVLYPIKVRFNEELKGSLAQSPYEKVAWETERLERRLAEARILADEGKLTPEVEAEVAQAITEHSEAAQDEIAMIRESDSDEAALAEITFSSALAVQSEMLEGSEANTLAGAVDAAKQTAMVSQQTNRPSFERLLARIEQESTSAYEFFSMIKDNASETEKRDIERRLKTVRRTVEDATRLNDEGSEEAVSVLAAALADTRKVISFMTDIDVRANVSIDDLVPVPETEEMTSVAERIDEVRKEEALARERLEDVDANTRMAVESRLAEVVEGIATASSTLAIGDTDAARDASDAALEIITEINVVLAAFATGTATSTDGN